MSFPPEILKKVKLIELSTRKLVNNVFTGEYHSAFKGQGMSFAEFREYVPGDDVRDISWGITARTGKTHIKRYDEERELTTILVVDVSGSGDFGSGEFCKGEILVHLAALLGFSANKNNDRVGLLLFSDQVEHFVPPKKGNGNIHRILRDLLYIKPKSKKTNLVPAIEHLQSVLKKQANVFILSDFYCSDYDKKLRQLSNKHDVTCLVIQDDLEVDLPEVGLVDFHDAETDEVFTIDTSNSYFRSQYKAMIEKENRERKSSLIRSGVQLVEIPSNDKYVDALISYFKKRNA